MSGLPPLLAPWAAPLAPFAPDLALTLGAWARRIAPAVGPLTGRGRGAGEPDGVSGLARRGSYEQLLLSEWLLAEDLPDEFLRRAAAHEHLFLDRARREPAAGRRSMALFDAGPEQLGGPRLAQLAVLVVLARRAEAAGATFSWGIAQRPELGLVDGFSADLCPRFLEARTEVPISPQAMARWWPALPPPAERDDLWLVGGATLVQATAPPGSSRLLVEDVAEPGARQVRLSLRARVSGAREVRLDLPPGADCVRLLRDPFSAAPRKVLHVDTPLLAGAGLLFDFSGSRLAVRLQGSSLFEVPVPNSPRATPGSGQARPAGPGLVAIGWDRRGKFFTTRMLGASVHLTSSSRPPPGWRLDVDEAGLRPLAPGPGERLGPCLLWPGHRAWFLDAAGVLFTGDLVAGSRLGQATVVAAGVVGLLNTAAWLATVGRDGPGLSLTVHSGGLEEVLPLGRGTGRAFLGVHLDRILVASEDEPQGLWTVRTASTFPAELGAARWLRPPTGCEVVGVVGHGTSDAGLVVVEPGRRSFALLDRSGITPVHQAEGEVVEPTISRRGDLGYTTSGGQVVVYSMGRRAIVLQVTFGASRS
jgi:hypothetical protein